MPDVDFKVLKKVNEDDDFTEVVIKSSLDMVAAYDLNFRITIFNPAAEEYQAFRRNRFWENRFAMPSPLCGGRLKSTNTSNRLCAGSPARAKLSTHGRRTRCISSSELDATPGLLANCRWTGDL